jgi:hypothetical protein
VIITKSAKGLCGRQTLAETSKAAATDQQPDHHDYENEWYETAGSTIVTIPIVTATAAEQQDQDNN